MKIAIVRLSAMGDILQSMIVLQFIKQNFSDCIIDWVVDNQFAEVLDDCDGINNVIKLNIKEIKANKSIPMLLVLIKKLRDLGKYDMVIDLQGLIKSSIVARLISANERVGFDKDSIREKFAANFYSKSYRFPYHENVILRYVGLVAACLEIKITEKEILNKRSLYNIQPTRDTRTKPNIVIILGASFSSKIYPVEKYIEIVNSLDANFIAVWHSQDEFIMAEKIKLQKSQVEITRCKNFSELKNTIINSDITIGGDTGPTHLAWALNKPSVTIFGSTPMERNCFITDKNLAISAGKKINPYKIDKKDPSIGMIESKIVISTIKKLL